ncbi:MAG: aromatic amino acid lyase, partial [Hyphomicrobiales bacterium]|nr:aromatic amino acid lyase [Hyphomicrobiales bacterium]
MTTLTIGKSALTLDDIRTVRRTGFSVELASQARDAVARAAQTITDLLSGDAPIYGVNTGFGKLASQSIADADLEQLQINLVRSHAAGTGRTMPAPVTRLIMLFKAQSLAAGHSGIRPETLDLLIDLINNDVLPVIPRQGSVGASGDLAPLSHMSLVL